MTLPKLLVFDLDGTLVDSRADLINTVNATLGHFGHAPLLDATVAGYIGDGVTALVRRSLAHAHLIAEQPDPHADAFIGQAVDWFLAFYRIHKLDFTQCYPGVLDSLAAIRGRNPHLPMAVLTNKPFRPSRGICDALNLSPFFFANYGGDSFATKKPHPEGLLHLIHQAAVEPAQTVMIGDSHVDIETARAAGTRSLGCSYGLSPDTLAAANPDQTVATAADWPRTLGL